MLTESNTKSPDATGLSRGDMYDECQVASKLAVGGERP
jgi:hypothetical protein